MPSLSPRITIRTVTSPHIASVIPDLQRVRAEVFRDFPYLYDGDPHRPADYLSSYAKSPDAALILAVDGEEVVGVATCLPLRDESDDTRAPFEARRWDLGRFFYYGEAVLRRAWRGQGIGVAFFEAREAQARAYGADWACFCSVRRPADHPARPSGYVPNDAFWRNRGYAPMAGVTCSFDWKEVGQAEETPHLLDFWGKSLTGAALPCD